MTGSVQRGFALCNKGLDFRCHVAPHPASFLELPCFLSILSARNMKNTAVINGIGLSALAFRPLVDGRSAFLRALDFARGLPGVTEVVLLLSRPVEDAPGCRVVLRPAWTTADLMTEMAKAGEGAEDLFYFFADCPFLDAGLSAAMHANHRRYWADYTFADGYPYGLTPEILTTETVARLRNAAGEGAEAPDRQTVFTLVSKDINSYDIETEISSVDLRMLRVSLCADTQRNFLLLSRIVANGGKDASGICALLKEKPRILRTLPAFYPVQIVERCPHACSYCPYPRFGGDILTAAGSMPVERFRALVKKIAAFCGDAVIDISLWGEPALHPQIFEIIGAALGEPGIDLVIETSGVGWEPGMFPRIRTSFEKQPTWIVSLDAASEALYRRLRGEGFAEARRAADELLSIFPARTWIQAVRMKENEEDLEVFYKSWKTRTENVIIQKYDTFGGLLPQRAVADLSPLSRIPCWHLKRDMAVLMDGTVPLCREDLRAATRLGNALDGELSDIWAKAQEIYHAHLAGDYPGICAGCDEYYTYNF
jgi:spiro-SPASM protein